MNQIPDETITELNAELDAENAFLEKINAAKEGKLIKIRMWTNKDQSSYQTHAEELSLALQSIERSSKFYANWSLEFISEEAE